MNQKAKQVLIAARRNEKLKGSSFTKCVAYGVSKVPTSKKMNYSGYFGIFRQLLFLNIPDIPDQSTPGLRPHGGFVVSVNDCGMRIAIITCNLSKLVPMHYSFF